LLTRSIDTWARFLIKHLKEDKINYEWYKLNVFTRWLFSSKQIVLIIFDPPPPIIERLPSPLLDEPDDKHLEDPFWIYTPLIEEVVRLQDQAVWAIRNQVRAVEREKMSATKPKPNYRLLHDISRHEIHVSETLGIAINTINSILENHKDFMASNLSVDATSNNPSKRIHQRLLFHKHMLDSLCHRSSSNKERLMNEIQLAFNTVAQYDSGISVEIGRAAQIDSAAMKTISFLTLTFLPATFTSTIFSMSFFNYSPDSRSWTVSGKFWIYWAVAIPLTVAASVVWYYWHKVFPPTLIGEEKRDEATSKSYC
jgi:Mg2+ and Co2+ transporter CorA